MLLVSLEALKTITTQLGAELFVRLATFVTRNPHIPPNCTRLLRRKLPVFYRVGEIAARITTCRWYVLHLRS